MRSRTTAPRPLLFYYIFDVLVLAGNDVTREPLEVRRALLENKILPKLTDDALKAPPVLEGNLHHVLQVVRTHGLEGVIAKRRDSLYEPGQRSGAWRKMRVNQGQEFVIGDYTPNAGTLDALILAITTQASCCTQCVAPSPTYRGRKGLRYARTPWGAKAVLRRHLRDGICSHIARLNPVGDAKRSCAPCSGGAVVGASRACVSLPGTDLPLPR